MQTHTSVVGTRAGTAAAAAAGTAAAVAAGTSAAVAAIALCLTLGLLLAGGGMIHLPRHAPCTKEMYYMHHGSRACTSKPSTNGKRQCLFWTSQN